MYLLILDAHGNTEVCRELAPTEQVDCEAAAHAYAESVGQSVDDSPGYVPSCSGDFRVEYRDDPDNSVHIWTGQSFYFAREE
jgi:hypothetical protein